MNDRFDPAAYAAGSAEAPANGHVEPASRARAATYAFIDVETTGVDPVHDRVVEVACVVMRAGLRLAAFSSLIDPLRTIPATASAVHHLTALDVAGAPTLTAIEPRLRSLCSGAIVVAHNARFDLAFLPFLSAARSLCSMRFAMHMIPDAPNFKNQVLRYHLGVDAGAPELRSAHRALADATVTSRIFAICLERYLAAAGDVDIETLLAAVSAPRRVSALRFGRYRGEPIGAVPAEYLAWIVSAPNISADVRFTAGQELAARQRSVA